MVLLADDKKGFRRVEVDPNFEESVQDAVDRTEFAHPAPRMVEYAPGRKIKTVTIILILE